MWGTRSMGEITKCTAKVCEIRESCYRHQKPESEWQSYADFSEVVNTQQQMLTARLKKENLDLFLNIFQATPQRIAEIFRANYLVPFQQVVTKLKTESLKKVRASYNLGQDTLQDIRTFLTAHLQIVDTFSDRIFVDSFPEAKLKEAIDRLRTILPWYTFSLRTIS